MTDHDWTDSVGAYLLGALPADEETAFEAHLETCEDCRNDVELLRVAAEALPSSPIQLTPPADLKGRVMAVVEAEASLLRAALPEPRRRRAIAVLRPGWWSVRPGLALAATLLVLAIGGAGALVGQSVIGGGGESSVLASLGDAELIQREGGHSTLVARGLDKPPAGHVYQVWLQRKGADPQPTNALFSAGRDGSASVDVPGSLKGVERVLVTSEPEGGSQTPTGDPVIIASPA